MLDSHVKFKYVYPIIKNNNDNDYEINVFNIIMQVAQSLA